MHEVLESNAALTGQTEELKLTAAKLNDSLKMFQEFLDMTDVGVYLTDFYTDQVIMKNSVIPITEEYWREYLVVDKEKLVDDNGIPQRKLLYHLL